MSCLHTVQRTTICSCTEDFTSLMCSFRHNIHKCAKYGCTTRLFFALRMDGCVLLLSFNTGRVTQGALMLQTLPGKAVGLGVMLRLRSACCCTSSNLCDCVRMVLVCVQLLGSSVEVAWDYCSPVVGLCRPSCSANRSRGCAAEGGL